MISAVVIYFPFIHGIKPARAMAKRGSRWECGVDLQVYVLSAVCRAMPCEARRRPALVDVNSGGNRGADTCSRVSTVMINTNGAPATDLRIIIL